MNRNDVTEMIVLAKQRKNLSWSQLSEAVGQSKEWSTAALLALAGVLGVGEGHLLHGKARRVKTADFAKSGSLFQSFLKPKVLIAFIISP